MVDVLIGAGTFTSASSFGTQSLQFFTMNELKKSVPGLYLKKKKKVSGQEKLRVQCQLGVLRHAKPLRCTRFLGRLHFAL